MKKEMGGKVIDLSKRKSQKVLDACKKNLETKGYANEMGDVIEFRNRHTPLSKGGDVSEKETPIGKSIERWNTLENMMIDPLIIVGNELENKKELTKREIRSLRATLKNITYKGFLLLGVAPISLEECYEMTKRYIKKNSV